MALILRNGGSQSPDRWLKEPRNNQERLGCLNYSPTHFGTSLPEVVEIRDSGEGNSVLVVDAVCDTFICNDAVITSELTVKFNDDKSFKYMGNKILNNGTKEVPKYQYRIKRKN